MALQHPDDFDVDRLRGEIRDTYVRVALEPEGDFHFHRGPAYASRLLGYDAEELAALPLRSTARFAGVGNPLRIGPVWPGETVLDVGCGAGTDLLLAARRVGPTGRAIGVDMTEEMRRCALESARELDLGGVVEVREGFVESLPVESGSVDVVISNGVLNLTPDKQAVFDEIARVLKPGGRLYLADVVVQRELKVEARQDPELWAACVAGALWEPELAQLAEAVGLKEARVTERFAAYAGTSAESKVSRDLRVGGANFFARR